MFAALPEALQASVFSYLAPRTIGDAQLALRAGAGVADLACWVALRGDGGCSAALYAGEESWRSLYALYGAISRDVAAHVPPADAEAAARFVLVGGEHRGDVEALDRGGAALARRRRAASRQRLAEAARRLGGLGRWEAGTALVRAALGEPGDAPEAPPDSPEAPRRGGLLRALSRRLSGLLGFGAEPVSPAEDAASSAAAPRPARWTARLLVVASTFLVDRLYASTYVFAHEADGRDVSDALAYARRAVAALEAAEDDGDDNDAAAVESDPARPRAAALESLAAQRVEAALARGRAAALCAQHAALGASRLREDWRAVFDEGELAFDWALKAAAAAGDALRVARATAGRGELWYCRASALSCRLQTAEQVEDVRLLARKSIAATREALGALRDLGLGVSRLSVSLLKDEGKVHGFLASIFGGDDGALSRARLSEALKVQGLLEEAGLDRERDNIHRLLKIGPDPAPDEIDEGAFTLNGDHIDGILDDARR